LDIGTALFSPIDHTLLIGALLLAACILASKATDRFGMPLLLIFLLLGMLAGDDGPGGIQFDDVGVSALIGNLALAVIVFDGGLRTHLRTFQIGRFPALTLATVGVLVTAAIAGAAAMFLLDLPVLEGLLCGAIISSTDAAAVFGLLRGHGIGLRERVGATLEIESGANDPMAVFLTLTLIDLVAQATHPSAWNLISDFLWDLGSGAVGGVVGGRILTEVLRRVRLSPGLAPLFVSTTGVGIFALVNSAGGSGLLAAYLAGIVVGNSRPPGIVRILSVHDGLVWLMQIGMFLILGLLVTPDEFIPLAPAALGVAAVLILVARPISVAACLVPFRFAPSEQAFIAWVGLRGAVPIILAMFPMLAGLPHSREIFNVAFFVVLVSLGLQGWTLPAVARRLHVERESGARPAAIVERSKG
jgi:potassium/hydrogen antiporter